MTRRRGDRPGRRLSAPLRAYWAGVGFLALTGFCCPWWFLGFAPLGAGAVWAAYDLIDDAEDPGGDTPRPTP